MDETVRWRLPKIYWTIQANPLRVAKRRVYFFEYSLPTKVSPHCYVQQNATHALRIRQCRMLGASLFPCNWTTGATVSKATRFTMSRPSLGPHSKGPNRNAWNLGRGRIDCIFPPRPGNHAPHQCSGWLKFNRSKTTAGNNADDNRSLSCYQCTLRAQK